MKYLLLILAIIVISTLGYYLGQKFYQEKLNSTNTTSKPLIAPLINEKTFTTSEPNIIVPTIKDTNKITQNNTSNTTQETKTTQEVKTTEKQNIKETEKTQETEEIQNTKEIQNTEDSQNNKTIKNDVGNKSTTTENNTDPEKGSFYIQLGSFNSIENANNLKQQLKEIEIEAKVEKIIQNNNENYRVTIGPYKTEEEALRESNKLKKLGFDNIVKNY